MTESPIIPKTAVGQHALDGACEMLAHTEKGSKKEDIISAHILASAAAEVLQKLATEHTGYSFYGAFRTVAINLGLKPEELNFAYNYFKHAKKDVHFNASFDPDYTLLIIYLAYCDLNRLIKIQPDKPHYIIKPASTTHETVCRYIALKRFDNLALAHLDRILENDDDEARIRVEEHIRIWFLECLNVVPKPVSSDLPKADDKTMITNWDDAYANGNYIMRAAEYPSIWAKLASDFRDEMATSKRAELDIAYGNTDREKYDLFLPKGTPKGLVVFVHGGYWKAFDKSTWSHLARGATMRGWAVCLPSYTLAPDARLSEITRQIGAAIDHVANRISGPIHLTGHSAGGHLVSRMNCISSPLSPSTQARVKNTVSISGLHDLRPLLKTAMNDVLKLDEDEAIAESAALTRPHLPCSITCWAGADERPEFVRQNDLLANIWTGLGAATRAVEAPGKHHFDVIADLADPASKLVTCLLHPIEPEDA